LDGDGDPEVIVLNELGDSVTVWENVDGVLSNRVDYATSKRPAALALGDIDGDGDLDIGIGSADMYLETTSLLYNDGAGRFAEAISFRMGFSNVLFADLDEDGREELIAGTNGNGSAVVVTDDLVQYLQNR
ncbi:MAG: VCBS repeat-containing protein, partial [Phycisphaerales bacterium]